jgi:hypothetical protein
MSFYSKAHLNFPVWNYNAHILVSDMYYYLVDLKKSYINHTHGVTNAPMLGQGNILFK